MLSSETSTVIFDLNVQEVFTLDIAPESQEWKISAETWQKWFQTWLESLLNHLPPAPSYELSLRLTGDEEIQAFNAQYRQKNQPTDVLAFAALEVDVPNPLDTSEPLYLGDIVISLETAHRQAEQQSHTLTIELAWLAAHGLLHLLGWDHLDDETLEEMLGEQETLLQNIHVYSNSCQNTVQFEQNS
ncbi:rRNA maturation RNase YbeY [Aphanothece sacrum]|nr:rRNA maturation RNase YbeY [Aphanothece sacrum]